MQTASFCAVFFLSHLNLTHSVVNRMAHHQLDLQKTRSATCHSHCRNLIPTLGKIYPQNAFPSGTPGTFQHETTQHNGTKIFKVPLDSVIFTRSLRNLYEICARSGFCKARQQGKAVWIFSTLPLCALRLSDHFYSSSRFSSLLFCK